MSSDEDLGIRIAKELAEIQRLVGENPGHPEVIEHYLTSIDPKKAEECREILKKLEELESQSSGPFLDFDEVVEKLTGKKLPPENQ